MKATIDFDETLYRRLKVAAAERGRTVRELVTEGVRYVIDNPDATRPAPAGDGQPPAWFGSLHKYAANAGGDHSMAAIRKSVARGRASGKQR